MLVYRSPMVRDDDPMYADVAALINRAAVAEEIYRGTVQDEGMMFGQGEWRVYLLHESSEPARLTDPRAIEAVNIIKGWGAPAHPVVAAGEMTNRLVH